jgi:hypothetical protein
MGSPTETTSPLLKADSATLAFSANADGSLWVRYAGWETEVFEARHIDGRRRRRLLELQQPERFQDIDHQLP